MLADILERLGDALSLPELSDQQLDELVALATDVLVDEDVTAVLAAVTAERERRIAADAGAQGADGREEAGDTS